MFFLPEEKRKCTVINVKEIVESGRIVDNVVEFQRKPEVQIFVTSLELQVLATNSSVLRTLSYCIKYLYRLLLV